MVGGNFTCWDKKQYTDYMYDGKVFVVIKGSKWGRMSQHRPSKRN